MLELFAKPILEIIGFFIKNAGTRANYKRSAKAAVRFHWLLSKMVEHSESFVEGIEIIRKELRVPSRINISINALQEDVNELRKMLAEDRFGFYTGFWRVWEIFRERPKSELDKIVGTKLQRLELWRKFLREISESGHLVIPTDTFKPPLELESGFIREDPNFSLKTLMAKGEVRIADYDDLKHLEIEIDKSKKIINHLVDLRSDMKQFIQEHYSFEDLF